MFTPMLAQLAAVVLTSAALGFEGPTPQAGDARPNVVFILADDLGWTDLGCYGSGYYRTPQIDRLASEGIRLTDASTCGPNCQPTRAALMSGQYGPRTGVYTVGSRDRFDWRSRNLEPPLNVTELDPEVVTVAEALKGAGYATGMFGKWHLGNDPTHFPTSQGFDEAIVSSGRHFDFKTIPRAEIPEGTYLADYLTDHAVDFIDRHRDEPFFLYLPHFGVHSPFEAKEPLIEQFQGSTPDGGHDDPTYAAMIASVDQSVGRVLEAIDSKGLGGRTLVIFSSDNGGVGGYVEAGLEGVEGITDNAPLRSGKGSLFEGGTRVPFIARMPGTIAPGIESSVPIISVDLYPTLLEFTGAEPPEGQPLDGLSVLPILTGQAESLDREALYWHFPGYLGASGNQWRTTPAGAIQVGDLKLIQFLEDGHAELYDLDDDLGQDRDLAIERPEDAERLLGMLERWREEINAPMPTPHKPEKRRRARRGG